MGVHADGPDCRPGVIPAALVSVILTTRDRPRLLPVALECYRRQTYADRELIVVDDGDEHPVAEADVRAVGGRLIRMAPGTPLGVKLNAGAAAARGALCQKMDDDDWYSPRFVANNVAAWTAGREAVCSPSLVCMTSFLFFEVGRWEIRQSIDGNAPGATFLFAREDWEECPFRPVRWDEDTWFLLDQLAHGRNVVPMTDLESFLAVRHRGAARDRGHTWIHQGDGRALEDYLKERPLYGRQPDELLAPWVLPVYRAIRDEIHAAAA
ncbi:MAG TPA: hypothetical protein DEH78_30540 [Solibacterales bacterium]|nr:hypothetical protein [Bryobacterales bacterium]